MLILEPVAIYYKFNKLPTNLQLLKGHVIGTDAVFEGYVCLNITNVHNSICESCLITQVIFYYFLPNRVVFVGNDMWSLNTG